MPEVTSLNWMRTSVFCSLSARIEAVRKAFFDGARESEHTFAGFQDKGNAVPPLVLDVQDHGTKGRTSRLLGNGIVLLVAWLVAVQRLAVLTDDDVLWLD